MPNPRTTVVRPQSRLPVLPHDEVFSRLGKLELGSIRIPAPRGNTPTPAANEAPARSFLDRLFGRQKTPQAGQPRRLPETREHTVTLGQGIVGRVGNYSHGWGEYLGRLTPEQTKIDRNRQYPVIETTASSKTPRVMREVHRLEDAEQRNAAAEKLNLPPEAITHISDLSANKPSEFIAIPLTLPKETAGSLESHAQAISARVIELLKRERGEEEHEKDYAARITMAGMLDSNNARLDLVATRHPNKAVLLLHTNTGEAARQGVRDYLERVKSARSRAENQVRETAG